MGTAGIVSATGGTIGTGVTTVIVTGIGTGDMVTVGSKYHAEIVLSSSLLLTLHHSTAVNAVVRDPLTDVDIKLLRLPCPFHLSLNAYLYAIAECISRLSLVISAS
jgi:hypothetical protein